MSQTIVKVIAASIAIILPQFSFAQEENPTTEISWIEVNLETPGSLGVEVLYKVDKLDDVKALKVIGTMNDADWGDIKNMPLEHLDLSNALSTNIPAEQFSGKQIQSIQLPDNLININNKAFYNSQLTEIEIPASVANIGSSAFDNCKHLTKISFNEHSQLINVNDYCFQNCTALTSVINLDKTQIQKIPQYCFSYCSVLNEITLPESISNIDRLAFYYDEKLINLNFPEGLTGIGDRAFYNSGLESAILPIHVNEIEYNAFYGTKLKELVLPADITAYTDNQFSNIPTLIKVTCPCALPPSGTGITINPGATLIVSEISLVSYKLSSFWMQFSDIQGTLTPDYYKVNGELQLTNNRRPAGTPDVVMGGNGKLLIGGNAAFNMSTLTLNADYYRNNENDTYSQIISNCPAVNANQVIMNFRPFGDYSSRWTFFSLPYDVNMSDITVTNGISYVIRYYDGASRASSGIGDSWKNVPADGKLEAGKGYILMANGDCTFQFPTEDASAMFDPNAHIISLEANSADDPADTGWNLVGNPYACCYDMYYSMLTSPVTVWNPKNNQYIAYSLIDDQLVLRPFENFFIQAGSDLNEINFSTQGRQFTTEVNREATAPAKDFMTNRRLFNLSISKGENTDRTRVVLNETASSDYEYNRDAAKFFSNTPIQFYTIDANGRSLAINERPYSDGIVNLGIYLEEPGEFTITADRLDGKAILMDSKTGKSHKLTPGTSIILDSEAGYIEDRFSLALDSNISTGVESMEEFGIGISVEDNTIIVRDAENANISIYTIDGKIIAKGISTKESIEFTLPQGIYIVKAASTTAKCIIK